MYIKSYRTTRFAGLKDTRLDFDKGLNIILGENESGKSTIINGIHSTLFKDTRLNRARNVDKEFIASFMPQPDGDFIDGSLLIKVEDEEYQISKEWGTSESIELVTPQGNIIREKEDIKKELARILSFGESTYSNIVFAKQRKLKEALNNIINNNELTREVSDLLRMTIMELDGVSIDAIENNIEDEIDKLYKRWNRERNYPENNRGINNPYKVGLGQIVESYYKKEGLKQDMDQAYRTEKEFSDISDRLKELQDRRELVNKEKIKLEEIEEDINRRSLLDVEIGTIEREVKSLMDISIQWPKTQLLLEQLEEKEKEVEEEKTRIDQERKNLEKRREKKDLEERLEKIGQAKKEIRDLEEEISKISPIEDKDIDELSRIEGELLRLETRMEAGKMIGLVKKTSDKPLYIKKDLGEEIIVEVGRDFQAKGLININYNDELQLEIKTSQIDFDEISREYSLLEEERKDLVKRLKIDSLEEGKENLNLIRRKEREIDLLEGRLESLLDNRRLEDLQEDLKELEDIKTTIELEEIEKEVARIRNMEIDLAANKRNYRSKIDTWTKEYKDHASLFDLVADKRVQLKSKEEELKNLSPLPEEFKDTDEFKKRLSRLRQEANQIQLDLEEVSQEYYEARSRMLDDTYEELRQEYLEAESLFKRKLTRGEKLLEIRKVFLETKERLAANPMETLVQEFTSLLEKITNGRYNTGEIDEEFNIRLENPSGEMPIELLSAGTYDAVSLALRFSLLRHIFNDRGGYLVLDDCLVDLDPVRKREAIRLIQDFAEDYQIIFTTCDPETARMLGGKLIEL